MQKSSRTFVSVCGALLIAATAAAQKTSYDFDKTADFGKFHTFAFKEGTSSGNPLVDERIVAAITSALSARGMHRDDSAPDLFIVTHMTYEKDKDITAYSSDPGYGAYGWYWGGGWGYTDIRVRDIVMGTLLIDFVDAGHGALIWRGMAEKELKSNPKPSTVDKSVNKAVTKILRNYPPPRKK